MRLLGNKQAFEDRKTELDVLQKYHKEQLQASDSQLSSVQPIDFKMQGKSIKDDKSVMMWLLLLTGHAHFTGSVSSMGLQSTS